MEVHHSLGARNTFGAYVYIYIYIYIDIGIDIDIDGYIHIRI